MTGACVSSALPPYPDGAELALAPLPDAPRDRFEAELRRRVMDEEPTHVLAWLPADVAIVGLHGQTLGVPTGDEPRIVRVIDAVDSSARTQLDCDSARYSFDFFVDTRALLQVATRRVRMTPAVAEEVEDADAEVTPGTILTPRAELFEVALRRGGDVLGSVRGRLPRDAIGRFFRRLESVSASRPGIHFVGGALRASPGGPAFAHLPAGLVAVDGQREAWTHVVATFDGVKVRGWVRSAELIGGFGFGGGGGRGRGFASAPTRTITLRAGDALLDPEHPTQRIGRARTTTHARCVDACTTYRPRVRVRSCLGEIDALVVRRRRGPPLMRLSESLRSSSRR